MSWTALSIRTFRHTTSSNSRTFIRRSLIPLSSEYRPVLDLTFRRKSNAANHDNHTMKITSQHTQILMSALSAAVNIAGSRTQVEHGRTKLRSLESQLAHREKLLDKQMSHERELFGTKADLLRALIKAPI